MSPKLLELLALPREAREVSDFNDLSKSFGTRMPHCVSICFSIAAQTFADSGAPTI